MFPVIQVGPFSIQAAGLILLAGLWLGLSLTARYARNFGTDSNQLEGLVLYSILAGIVGARLFYVFRYPQVLMKTPLSVFSLNPTMFDGTTGILIAVLAMFIIIQRRKMDFWRTLDAITPLLSVLSVALAFTHLATGSIYGISSDLPWAISLWGQTRHPTQIYEIILASVVLVLLWTSYRHREKSSIPLEIKGLHFLSFGLLAAVSWIIVVTFQADTVILFDRLRILHIFLLGLIIILIGLVERRMKEYSTDQ